MDMYATGVRALAYASVARSLAAYGPHEPVLPRADTHITGKLTDGYSVKTRNFITAR